LEGVSEHRMTSAYLGQQKDKKETRTFNFFLNGIRTQDPLSSCLKQYLPQTTVTAGTNFINTTLGTSLLFSKFYELLCPFCIVFFRLLVSAYQDSVMQLRPLHGNQLHVHVPS